MGSDNTYIPSERGLAKPNEEPVVAAAVVAGLGNNPSPDGAGAVVAVAPNSGVAPPVNPENKKIEPRHEISNILTF